ncbi:hypothetical protein [Snodgrassella alvi]|nr:hypothetical protein [Snodgrassella sp. B3837]
MIIYLMLAIMLGDFKFKIIL